MSPGKLKKNEFLALLSESFLAASPAWTTVYEHKRHYEVAVGRSFGGCCLVFVSFGCRPDRYWFGQSVGWCPSIEHYLEWKARRENPRDYPQSGRLRYIQTLDKPKDFENVEMRTTVQELYTHYVSHSLEADPPEKVLGEMLSALEAYALPYLGLMLAARHGMKLSVAELRGVSAV